MTFGTATFSKELLFRRSYSLNFLFRVLQFLEKAFVKRTYLKHQIFVKTIFKDYVFFKAPLIVVHSLKQKDWSFTFLLYELLLEDQLKPAILSFRVIFLME